MKWPTKRKFWKTKTIVCFVNRRGFWSMRLFLFKFHGHLRKFESKVWQFGFFLISFFIVYAAEKLFTDIFLFIMQMFDSDCSHQEKQPVEPVFELLSNFGTYSNLFVPPDHFSICALCTAISITVYWMFQICFYRIIITFYDLQSATFTFVSL